MQVRQIQRKCFKPWRYLFMALTLAIVSFSCTGPILGSPARWLTKWRGLAAYKRPGRFWLSAGIAFALFAIFPHWLQSLPKSGGWLDTVKIPLLLLSWRLPCNFINADLVMHWGLIKRSVYRHMDIDRFGLTLYLLEFCACHTTTKA